MKKTLKKTINSILNKFIKIILFSIKFIYLQPESIKGKWRGSSDG